MGIHESIYILHALESHKESTSNSQSRIPESSASEGSTGEGQECTFLVDVLILSSTVKNVMGVFLKLHQ